MNTAPQRMRLIPSPEEALERIPIELPAPNVGRNERIASGIAGGALVGYAIHQRSWSSLLFGGVGAFLLFRGTTGYCAAYDRLGFSTAEPTSVPGVTLEASLTIYQPVEKVYAFYRRLTNLPRFMKHLEAVEELDPRRSHWVVRMPGGYALEWDAEITHDLPGELIRWRSLPGADLVNFGEVRFIRAPGDRGTELRVSFRYEPGNAALGLFASMVESVTEKALRYELRYLKQILETGEISTTEGQTSGREPYTEEVRS